MSAVKLAPIFSKNYVFDKNKTRTKIKKGSTRKLSANIAKCRPLRKCNRAQVKHDNVIEVLVEEDSSLTDTYFTEDEEIIFLKKQKRSQSESDEVEVINCAAISQDSSSNDVWANKYTAFNSEERIGSDIAFSQLSSCLLEWKNSKTNVFYDEDSMNEISKCCVIIYGPPGVGKTSLVYAVANALDFKVFEVNCSSPRNGKAITEQLKEATESSTINRHKSSDNGNSVPVNNAGDNIADIFKKSLNSTSGKMEKFNDCTKASDSSQNSMQSQSLSFTNDSLILFDDVDVIFEEDDGFWKAVNALIQSGKPVVMTSTDPIENIQIFVDNFTILRLQRPCSDRLAELLYSIASQESVSTSLVTCQNIVSQFKCDIRRCFNEFQFDHTRFSTNFQSLETCICQKSTFREQFDYGLFCDLITSQLTPINEQNKLYWNSDLLEDINSRHFLEEIKYEFGKLHIKVNENLEKCTCVSKRRAFIVNDEIEEAIGSLKSLTSITFTSRELALDYFPYLSEICKAESSRYQQYIHDSRRCRRFQHYFNSISFYISNELKQILLKNFFDQQYL